jgi:hypothetical protein
VGTFWAKDGSLLFDAVGLIACESCPCPESSGSGSSSIVCGDGCYQLGALVEENVDPTDDFPRVYTVTIEMDQQIACGGDVVHVTITIDDGSGGGCYAPQLGVAVDYGSFVLSNLTPYDASRDSYTSGNPAGFGTLGDLLLQYDAIGGSPREITTVEFDLTFPNTACTAGQIVSVNFNPGDQDTIYNRDYTCCTE